MKTEIAHSELLRRRPILSARLVAVAVIFGAINGAFSALQISIPGYLPGVTFDFGGLWLTLATMLGGPLVGAIVTLVGSLADPQVGIIGWPGYLIHVLIFAAFYPRVFRIQKLYLRIIAFILVIMLALFVQYWYWIVLFSFVYKYMGFLPMLALDFGYAYWVFLLIYCAVPAIVLIAVPNLVAPVWRWPWQKEMEDDELDLVAISSAEEQSTEVREQAQQATGQATSGETEKKEEETSLEAGSKAEQQSAGDDTDTPLATNE